MNRKLLSAAALALVAASAAPGLAQVRQLTDSAEVGLARLGIASDDIGTITADQAAQIEGVLGSTAPDAEKIARIDIILGDPGDALVPQPLGVDQLRASVVADMAKLGMGNAGVDALTLDELAQIENVVNSATDDESKRAQIEVILGNTEALVGSGAGQLPDSVGADLVKLGIDPSGIEALSVSQLAEIENVVGSTDTDAVKRGRIERIMVD